MVSSCLGGVYIKDSKSRVHSIRLPTHLYERNQDTGGNFSTKMPELEPILTLMRSTFYCKAINSIHKDPPAAKLHPRLGAKITPNPNCWAKFNINSVIKRLYTGKKFAWGLCKIVERLSPFFIRVRPWDNYHILWPYFINLSLKCWHVISA